MATVAKAIKYRDKIIEFPLEYPEENNIPDEELHEHLAKPSTERTKRLKARCRFKHTAAGEFVEKNLKAGVERMRYFTESHKESVGKPNAIRRAMLLENLLNKCTLVLQEDELIVGFNAEHPDKIPLYPETSYMTVLDYIQSRNCPEEKEEAIECNEYWKEHSIQALGERYFGQDELLQMYQFTSMEPPAFANAYNSVCPPYETVLEDGLLKRIEIAEQNRQAAIDKIKTPDWNATERLPLLTKIDNWDAMIIADKAVVSWARRHARLCKIVAERFETNPRRKNELIEIADICQHVPAEPAKGLRDAMQAKWFTYLISHSLENYASGYAQKEDSLLWPYYKSSVIDKSFQSMTHADVVELVECERLKVSEHGCGKNRAYREAFPGSNDLFILTIGGLNADGTDGCNDMSDAILEGANNIRTTEPSIGFRWNTIGREKTKRLVFECVRAGLGFPSIKNDEVATEQLQEKFGATQEEARSWALQLCMSPGITGRRKTQKSRTEGGGSLLPAKMFEITLSDGYDWSHSDMQLGPKTGDPRDFKTFEELFEAFYTQFSYCADLVWRAKDITRYCQGLYGQLPFVSSLDDGCMEKGVDAMVLCELPNPWHNCMTNIVACNSLIACKKLIYDDKKYTMVQLIKALHANWEGYEEMHKDFRDAPKWGNDDDYADEIVKRVYEGVFAKKFKKISTYSGGPPMPGGQAVGAYLFIGARTGPTPDGRFGGEACDDGGISPMAGTDKKGPTAVIKSVAKIDSSSQKFNLLNQRLSLPLMRSTHGFGIWHAYMKTWHGLKLDHVQFNCVSNKEMRAAQKEPEKHGDLIVRVAGFSARFVDVATYGQNTIIARNEQNFTPYDFDELGVEFTNI